MLAIDPSASPPGRPRWFGLDSPQVAARLAAGPALLHFVARVEPPGDINQLSAEHPQVGSAPLLLLLPLAQWPDARAPAAAYQAAPQLPPQSLQREQSSAVASVPLLCLQLVAPPIPVERGPFRWRLTVPDDGSLPSYSGGGGSAGGTGLLPTVIQW